MAKLYTLDEKLLTDCPEVRIKDKVYAVDDRMKTVKKLMKLSEDGAGVENIDEILSLGLGKEAFREIEAMDLSFAAYERLLELVTAAMTGEEPDAVKARFPKSPDIK